MGLYGETQIARWKEHFQDLLNQPKTIPVIIPETTELPLNKEVSTKEEIRKTIIQLSNSKAAGHDGIPAEILKFDKEVGVDTLEILFKQICMEKEVPAEWKEEHIVKI